jgi:hypothetical protein
MKFNMNPHRLIEKLGVAPSGLLLVQINPPEALAFSLGHAHFGFSMRRSPFVP